MRKLLIAIGMIVGAALPMTASGAAISLGSTNVNVSTSETIAVNISGGETITALDFWVQINDGGAIVGGSDTTPAFAANGVDLIGPGTIFNADNSGQDDVEVHPLVWYAYTDTGVSGTLSASGTLAFLTIDTSALNPGDSFTIQFGGIANNDTTLYSDLDVISVSGLGPITVNVVPEPASVGLVGLLAGGMMLRRRRA